MSDQKFGASMSYTPWLRNLGVNDIYLAYLSGFYQFGSGVKQAVGVSLRYFSLGEIQWTDYNATPLGTGSPREFEFAASYARQLSENFSVGATAKYVYSNLATGQSGGGGGAGNTIKSLTALSGGRVSLEGDQVWIHDAGPDFINLNGAGRILINASTSIVLKVGDSEIIITTAGITIKATVVKVDSDQADIQGKLKAVLKKDDSTYFKAEGTMAEIKGAKVEATATAGAKLNGATVNVTGTGPVKINGGIVEING